MAAGRQRVLVTGGGYESSHLARLNDMGYEVLYHEAIDRGDLESLIPTADAYLLGGDERLDAALLERAQRLKVVSFVGTGFGEFVDVDAARRGHIDVRNTPGVASPAMVEHTMGLLLGVVRGLFAYNDAVKRGGSRVGTTPELSSLTVGIVGLGDIATRLARVLRVAFQARVIYASRTRKPGLEEELGLVHVELRDLFAEADVVVLLVASSTETVELVGAELFGQADKAMSLVNTAAARLVDPRALLSALQRGRVTAAAFDGYWIEPLPSVADDPFGLLRLPDAQFVVTPHVAAKTPQTWGRMLELAIENLSPAQR